LRSGQLAGEALKTRNLAVADYRTRLAGLRHRAVSWRRAELLPAYLQVGGAAQMPELHIDSSGNSLWMT
jgi:hypothetical protein